MHYDSFYWYKDGYVSKLKLIKLLGSISFATSIPFKSYKPNYIRGEVKEVKLLRDDYLGKGLTE